MASQRQQISRAGRRRIVALARRTWEASDESLRNFIGKTREEDAAFVQFTSFGASFRALSGASSDASEEVFVSRPADSNGAQALRKTRCATLALRFGGDTCNINRRNESGVM